ncbi:MAG: NYN domain-containing protein [Immundisolibacter sp.]|nr:NYN domain-containing protein [Immundisolibacter sp.]MDD3652178.1 NYN domain-containing protein [Immundisolibacter sp.]
MSTSGSHRTPILAVFCDFENVALGVRDAKYDQFDIRRVLERLLLKGPIVVKKAYCDWERYKKFKPAMHEAAFEMIEIPHLRQSGKNSADIRLVVDALDLCYTKSHVNTFVIVSGDSDFSPLVSKLRENNKEVIGVGVASSTSDLLIANCDEFIYYDDLVRAEVPRKPARRRSAKPKAEPAKAEPARIEPATEPAPVAAEPAPETPAEEPKRKPRARGGRRKRGETVAVAADATESLVETLPVAEAPAEPESPAGDDEQSAASRADKGLRLIMETVAALVEDRGEEQKIWGSMVKQTLRRRRPGFNERFHGFRSFNDMLEEAAARGWLTLERDSKSGGYIVHPVEGGYVPLPTPDAGEAEVETVTD